MLETIIVIAVVGTALFYAGRSLKRSIGDEASCGCEASCPSAGPCDPGSGATVQTEE